MDGRAAHYHVVVVGGGPAGATAAHELALKGRRVLLLDRAGRIKPCGGAIPTRLIEDFAIPPHLIKARIRSARIVAPSNASADMKIEAGGGGSDTQDLANAGVPTLGLYTVRKHYFDWHHTAADTIDKVDKKEFRRNIAALAVASYILADMTGHLGDAPRP